MLYPTMMPDPYTPTHIMTFLFLYLAKISPLKSKFIILERLKFYALPLELADENHLNKR
jgi:hypothetical protein